MGTPAPLPEESGPSVIIIVAAAVGGFFAFVIICCALKAVCSSSGDQKRKQKEALERAKERQRQQAAIKAKITKPKPNYEGATYNNIPIVRADDDPNAKQLKPKKNHKAETSLADTVKDRDTIDDGTFRKRQELENEIIGKRQRQLQQMEIENGVREERNGKLDRFRIENEVYGRDLSRNLNNEDIGKERGLGRPRGKLDLERTVQIGRTRIHPGDIPPPPPAPLRKNKIRDGEDFPPKEEQASKTDLSRFKPQELPKDWLPPSQRTSANKPTTFTAPRVNQRISHQDSDELTPEFRRADDRRRQAKQDSKDSDTGNTNGGFDKKLRQIKQDLLKQDSDNYGPHSNDFDKKIRQLKRDFKQDPRDSDNETPVSDFEKKIRQLKTEFKQDSKEYENETPNDFDRKIRQLKREFKQDSKDSDTYRPPNNDFERKIRQLKKQFKQDSRDTEGGNVNHGFDNGPFHIVLPDQGNDFHGMLFPGGGGAMIDHAPQLRADNETGDNRAGRRLPPVFRPEDADDEPLPVVKKKKKRTIVM